MRALIIDDERLARAELRRLLKSHPQVEVVGEAGNPAEARVQIDALEPQLLFLDIQMPGGTGFDLLTQLDQAPRVIFTTAYDAHALRAFEVNALDYLLKPIDPVRLEVAVRKALVTEPASAAPGGPGRDAALERVFVKDGERCWFVELVNVPLLESEGNYARLFLGDQRPLLSRSLNHLEEHLDPKLFFRASRRHLINLRAIESIESGFEGRLRVRLRGGLQVEMSRRQSQRFREQMSP